MAVSPRARVIVIGWIDNAERWQLITTCDAHLSRKSAVTIHGVEGYDEAAVSTTVQKNVAGISDVSISASTNLFCLSRNYSVPSKIRSTPVYWIPVAIVKHSRFGSGQAP